VAGAGEALGAAAAASADAVEESGALDRDVAVRVAGASRGSLVCRVGLVNLVDLARVESLIDMWGKPP